jgi:hypothetical protein
MTTASVTYRFASEADIPRLLRLWQEVGEWGPLTAEEWREWYRETPAGPTSVIIAEDQRTGEVGGQFVFIPSLLSINGREVCGARPSAPILTPALAAAMREVAPHEHPIASMYTHAVNVLRDRGYALVYMLPDPRWLRAFQMMPYLRCASFPLWSRPLPLGELLPLGPGYTAGPLTTKDARVDALWHKTAGLHGCLIVRDTRTLPWKIGDPSYVVIGVERRGELVGLVASQHKGEHQWLVCDLLAADNGPSVRALLAAAANLAHARAMTGSSTEPIRKVGVLVTAALEPAARELGFTRDDYEFPLAVHVLDSSLADEAAPERWYVSAND